MDNNTKEQILSDNLGMQYHSATAEQLSLYHQVMDQYAAQVLENQDHWISVKDSLPENRDKIWVGSKKKQEVSMGYYSQEMKGFFDTSGSGLSASHWKPITKPTPPKTTE